MRDLTITQTFTLPTRKGDPGPNGMAKRCPTTHQAPLPTRSRPASTHHSNRYIRVVTFGVRALTPITNTLILFTRNMTLFLSLNTTGRTTSMTQNEATMSTQQGATTRKERRLARDLARTLSL